MSAKKRVRDVEHVINAIRSYQAVSLVEDGSDGEGRCD
jgi:hypothetical protein